jgi:hypothetical protein
MKEGIIKLLEKKGIIASIVGFLLALPVNGYTVYLFFKGTGLTEGQQDSFLWINIVAWIWVILPSSIKLVSKGLTLEVTD